MKNNNRKNRVKLALGIENPLDTLVRNQKMMADAWSTVENNDLYAALEFTNQLGGQVGVGLSGMFGNGRQSTPLNPQRTPLNRQGSAFMYQQHNPLSNITGHNPLQYALGGKLSESRFLQDLLDYQDWRKRMQYALGGKAENQQPPPNKNTEEVINPNYVMPFITRDFLTTTYFIDPYTGGYRTSQATIDAIKKTEWYKKIPQKIKEDYEQYLVPGGAAANSTLLLTIANRYHYSKYKNIFLDDYDSKKREFYTKYYKDYYKKYGYNDVFSEVRDIYDNSKDSVWDANTGHVYSINEKGRKKSIGLLEGHDPEYIMGHLLYERQQKIDRQEEFRKKKAADKEKFDSLYPGFDIPSKPIFNTPEIKYDFPHLNMESPKRVNKYDVYGKQGRTYKDNYGFTRVKMKPTDIVYATDEFGEAQKGGAYKRISYNEMNKKEQRMVRKKYDEYALGGKVEGDEDKKNSSTNTGWQFLNALFAPQVAQIQINPQNNTRVSTVKTPVVISKKVTKKSTKNLASQVKPINAQLNNMSDAQWESKKLKEAVLEERRNNFLGNLLYTPIAALQNPLGVMGEFFPQLAKSGFGTTSGKVDEWNQKVANGQTNQVRKEAVETALIAGAIEAATLGLGAAAPYVKEGAKKLYLSQPYRLFPKPNPNSSYYSGFNKTVDSETKGVFPSLKDTKYFLEENNATIKAGTPDVWQNLFKVNDKNLLNKKVAKLYDPQYDEINDETVKRVNEYMRNWNIGRLGVKRSYASPDNIIEGELAALHTPYYSGFHPRHYGWANFMPPSIGLNNHLLNKNKYSLFSNIIHEKAHQEFFNNPDLALHLWKKTHGSIPNKFHINFLDNEKQALLFPKKYLRGKKEPNEYYDQLTEIHSRLGQWRKLKNLKSTDFITEQQIKKWRKENGIKKSLFSPIEEKDLRKNFLNRYSDDYLKFLFNEVYYDKNTDNNNNNNNTNNMFYDDKQYAAYGGQLGTIPAEVEGGEVAQDPYGNLMQFFGNSHEQGGIDIDLPEGTEVFSKRIKIDNVTLADRKKRRETRLKKLQKKLDKNQSDVLLKNALTRTQENNEKEDVADKTLQEKIREFLQQEQNPYPPVMNRQYAALGLPEKRNQQNFNFGETGIPEIPIYSDEDIERNKWRNDYNYNQLQIKDNDFYNKYGLNLAANQAHQNYMDYLDSDALTSFQDSRVPIIPNNWYHPAGYDRNEKPLQGLRISAEQQRNAYSPNMADYEKFLNSDGQANPVPTSTKTKNKNKSWTENLSYMPTIGDMAGIFGNLFQGYAPYRNTLESRAGDLPNVNSFERFGENTLNTLSNQRSLLEQNRARQMSDLTLARNASLNRNRNSAMSVNTQRALDLAADMQLGRLGNEVDTQYNQQLNQLLGMTGQSQMIQDQYKMMGESQKLEADKADRDAYYTQMSKDLANIGNMYSQTGKSFNQMQQRGDSIKMLNQLYNNVGYNGVGGFYGKPNTGTDLYTSIANFDYKKAGITDEKWNTMSETEKGNQVLFDLLSKLGR
jgi:hypothetical protein